MAPEIIENNGYEQYVDLWSIGVLLYQMVTGDVPYGSHLSKPYDIYKKIINSELEFPESLTDKNCKSLIT